MWYDNNVSADLYASPNIIMVIKSRGVRWTGYVARVGEIKNVHRMFVGKPEEKRQLGRRRRK
jgi:hypothetical protein